MKIIQILLFLINLMVISSNVVPQGETSQSVTNSNLNKFERDCPYLWKIVQEKNLEEWDTCQNTSGIKGKISENDVLEFACFTSYRMLTLMCDLKLNMTDEYLSERDDGKMCPFVFTQIADLEFNNSLAKELTNETHCLKICYDLYDTKYKCVILKKLNDLLKSVALQQTRIGLVLPDVPVEINTPTLKALKVDNNKTLEQKTTKETTIKAKTETTSNKHATEPIKVTESKATESKIPETERPITSPPKMEEKLEIIKNDLETPDEDNKEMKTKDDDLLTEDTFEEDLDPLNSPVKSEPSQTDVWEDEKRKVQMSYNRKEINTADGFFQAEDSHFFFYFIVISSIVVIGYIGFHNKNKILAYALEGTNGRRSRRRPNPARYRKLETNLEEAISSNPSETVASSVVY